jgi:hypothetical protein
MGIRKTNASEPLMRCRDLGNDIETGASMRLRDEPGGSPFTGQAVSGIEAASAWSAAAARNMGRRALILRLVRLMAPGARGRTLSGRNREAQSTDAAAPADRLVVVMKLL